MKPVWDTQLMREDAAEKGWNVLDVAEEVVRRARKRRAKAPARATVYRFFDGQFQTPRVASLIAAAIGQPLRRYLVRASTPRVATV